MKFAGPPFIIVSSAFEKPSLADKHALTAVAVGLSFPSTLPRTRSIKTRQVTIRSLKLWGIPFLQRSKVLLAIFFRSSRFLKLAASSSRYGCSFLLPIARTPTFDSSLALGTTSVLTYISGRCEMVAPTLEVETVLLAKVFPLTAARLLVVLQVREKHAPPDTGYVRS